MGYLGHNTHMSRRLHMLCAAQKRLHTAQKNICTHLLLGGACMPPQLASLHVCAPVRLRCVYSELGSNVSPAIPPPFPVLGP